MNICDLLGPDPLAQIEHEVAIDCILQRLADIFPKGADRREALVLRPFVQEAPLSYWDDATVRDVLSCLEQDISRSYAAIDCRCGRLNIGIENLHRASPTKDLQDSYDHGRAHELLILANYFLPEYLRLAEHVLGNLLPIIWSVRKKGGVDGKFVLKNAITFFESDSLRALAVGYNDRVRNAIAHGEVRFTGLDIEFGSEHPSKFSSLEFLRLFDDLTRVCSSLGLATELFWLKNGNRARSLRNLPLSLITMATAGAVMRDGLRFLGGIESASPIAGKQLHVALQVDTNSKTQILLESSRVARDLIDRGATGFDRFLFEVDSGKGASSLVIILPKALKKLLDEKAPIDRLPTILADTQLLWYDESRFVTSLRAWTKIAKASMTKARRDVASEWHRHGLFRAKGCYVLCQVQNLSVDGIARVEVRARLVHPDYAQDRNLVNAVIVDLIRLGRHRFVSCRSGPLDKGIPWRKRPSHVFAHLFRREGPSRWLQRDGWMGGNVVAIAERVWGAREYVLVKKSQAEMANIRVRYEMDYTEAAAVFRDVAQFVSEVRKQHGLE